MNKGLTLITQLMAGTLALAAEPGQAAVAALDFSWDTVPRFLYSTGSKQLTAEELDYVAENFSWVTFAINFAEDDSASYDEAIEYAAAELEQRNPNIKVLYYWNATRIIGNYRANEDFDPAWDLSDGRLGYEKNGKPIRLADQPLPVLDISIPEAREWWLNNAFDALQIPNIDGIWVDAVPRIYNRGPMRRLKQAGLWEETEKGLYLIYGELAQTYRKHKGIIMGNFLREHDEYPYKRLWPFFDGSFVENHYNHIGREISDEEYIENVSNVISNVQDASREGKVIGFYAGSQGTDPAYDRNRYSFAERERKQRQHLKYNLALYLILADEHVYFQYTDGFNRDWAVWRADFPEYHYRLGSPKGPATRTGDVYKREFAHAAVVLDIKNRTADITWRERLQE